MCKKNSATALISQAKSLRNLNKNYEWLIRERNLRFQPDETLIRNRKRQQQQLSSDKFYVYRGTEKIQVPLCLEIWKVGKYLSTLILNLICQMLFDLFTCVWSFMTILQGNTSKLGWRRVHCRPSHIRKQGESDQLVEFYCFSWCNSIPALVLTNVIPFCYTVTNSW